MNLWILKYDYKPFDKDFLNKLDNYCSTIPQLETREHLEFNSRNFHFLSFTSKGIPKKYNKIDNDTLKGYSGLIVDKSKDLIDYRYIENITIDPSNIMGQFALYKIQDSFICYGDNLGFHKVFYGKKGNQIYVTNSYEFMKMLNLFETDYEQMLKDFTTVRFGIYPGYGSHLKDVKCIKEYSKLIISASGNLEISEYQEINTLLNPYVGFEEKLDETKNDFKNSANYLRKYHCTTLGLSGGFDGRLILNMFHGTSGKSLETYTYNRAGNLDLYIAKYLSKKAGVQHKSLIFNIKEDLKNIKAKISPYRDFSGDAFETLFQHRFKDVFKENNEYKVSLGGNGADTDWEFGDQRIADVDKSNMYTFINDYVDKLVNHHLLLEDLKTKFAVDFKSYFGSKYSVFFEKDNWQQLLASSFFHLERFRGGQSFKYSQQYNKYSDIFAPFALESFNQLVFLANEEQLQRGLREGIHYRLSTALTNNNIVFAPILTSANKNEHGNNVIQDAMNKIAPILPKIIWKLNGGDTSRLLGKIYESQNNKLYKQYILDNQNNILFDYLKKDIIVKELEKKDYNGSLNNIGKMIKSIEENIK